MEWTTANFVATTLFVSLGALLQSVTGLGAGLLIVPMLAGISFELIPGPMIFASLVLTGTMAFRGRKRIDFTHTGTLLTGLTLGTVLASWYIASLPVSKFGLLFGVFILLAVVISIKSPSFSSTPKNMLGAGALSGFMGTSAGVGAPVLAMLYQHKSGPSIRATLAFLYFISSLIMLSFLNLAGRFGEAEVMSGLYLIPGFILGYIGSPKLVAYIDRGYARAAVLVVSSISAMALIGRSLWTMYT